VNHDDVDTRNSDPEDNCSVSSSTVDGVDYHMADNPSTTSVAYDIGN